MFDLVVLGVDPGTASVGLGVVGRRDGKAEVVWAGTLRTPPGLPAEERLRRLYLGVEEAIATHHPDVLALERLMWGRNVGSAMEVARASGAIMVAAAVARVPVEEYAPLEVKMAVTGAGAAPKSQVRRALGFIVGTKAVPQDADAADAVAVAVCHIHQSRLRRVAREAAL